MIPGFLSTIRHNSCHLPKVWLLMQVPFFRLLEQHIGDQRSFDHPHVCACGDIWIIPLPQYSTPIAWSQWNVEIPYIHHGFELRGCLI